MRIYPKIGYAYELKNTDKGYSANIMAQIKMRPLKNLDQSIFSVCDIQMEKPDQFQGIFQFRPPRFIGGSLAESQHRAA